jgi:hypothetical protein
MTGSGSSVAVAVAVAAGSGVGGREVLAGFSVAMTSSTILASVSLEPLQAPRTSAPVSNTNISLDLFMLSSFSYDIGMKLIK